MRTLAIIPARYASTRFPGKPLALLAGKPIIQWVWESVNSMPELAAAVVATDDERILQAVQAFGGRAMLTGSQHRSGTDRCGEVLRTLEQAGEHFDVVINLQGDEPFVRPDQLRSLISSFADPAASIVTLRTPIRTAEELFSPNNVKVVASPQGQALYFSRQPIPHLRGADQSQWVARQSYYKHVGIYAFRAETLKAVVQLAQSPLELAESLEQLRWLENGHAIRVVDTEHANIGIDTPADLEQAERILAQQQSSK